MAVNNFFFGQGKVEGASGAVGVSGSGTSGGSGGSNNYVSVVTFDINDGILTLQRQGLGNLTVDLDGRYALQSTVDAIGLQEVTNVNHVTTNPLVSGAARMSTWSVLGTYAYFGHKDKNNSTEYGILHTSLGQLILNSTSTLDLRINGSTVSSVNSSGLNITGDLTVTGKLQTNLGGGILTGNWGLTGDLTVVGVGLFDSSVSIGSTLSMLSGQKIYWGSASESYIVGDSSSNNLKLGTSGIDRLTISDTLSLFNTPITIDTDASGSTVLLNVGGDSNGQLLVRHIEGKVSNSSSAGELFLNYYGTSNVYAVTGGGSFGIGTQSVAGYKLAVAGSTLLSSGVNGNTDLFLGTNQSSGRMTFSSNTAYNIEGGSWYGYLRLNSPTTIRLNQDTDIIGDLSVNSGTTTLGGGSFRFQTSGTLDWGSSFANGRLTWGTGFAEIQSLSSNELRLTSGSGTIVAQDNVAVQGTLVVGGSDPLGYQANIESSTNGLRIKSNNDSGQYQLRTLNSSSEIGLAVRGDGKVSIGTADPLTYAFRLIGSSSLEGNLSVSGATTITGNATIDGFTDLKRPSGAHITRVQFARDIGGYTSYYNAYNSENSTVGYIGIGASLMTGGTRTDFIFRAETKGHLVIGAKSVLDFTTNQISIKEAIQFRTNVWNTSDDNNERLYFGNGSSTYIKSPNKIIFRTESSNTDNSYIDNGKFMTEFHNGSSWGIHDTAGFHTHLEDNSNATWLISADQKDAGNVHYGIQVINTGAQIRVYAGGDYVGLTSSGANFNGSVLATESWVNANMINEVTTGAGLDGSATSGLVNISLDLNELPEGNTLIGSDKLVAVNNVASEKQTISSIPLSIFNNDAGWTSNLGTITGITTSNGLNGNGTSGSVNISLNLEELATAGSVLGSDKIVIVDNVSNAKIPFSAIGLSVFNNDIGFITSADGGNAATLSGYSLSIEPSSNTIPLRDSSGYMHSTWINLENGTGLYTENSAYFFHSSNYWAIRNQSAYTSYTYLKFQTGSVGSTDSGGVYADTSTNIGFVNSSLTWKFRAGGTGGMFRSQSGAYVNLELRTSEDTTRGQVYANTSNQIGFLNSSGNWAYRTGVAGTHEWMNSSGTAIGNLSSVGNLTITGDLYSNGQFWYGDSKKIITFNDTYLRLNQDNHFSSGVYTPYDFRVDGVIKVDSVRGIANVSGSYGTIQTNGAGVGGWNGYSIDGRVVFMHDGISGYGLYDDTNNQWAVRATQAGKTEIRYGGAVKIETTSVGVTVTGQIDTGIGYTDLYLMNQNVRTTDSVTFANLSGDGSGLTNVNASTLGGISSSNFLRSDTSDTFNGVLTINSTASEAIRVQSPNSVGSVYLRFENNSGVDKGYVGYGSASTDVLYLLNDIAGDIQIRTTTGAIRMYVNGTDRGNFNTSGLSVSGQISTGVGYTELHLMNQNVRTSDNVTFNQVSIGAGGAFYSDASNRIRTNADFYTNNANTYLYGDNTYLGNSSGDTIHFRANTVTADNWGITSGGVISALNGDSNEWNTAYDRSVTGFSWNASNGVLTLNKHLGSITIDLDGRYSLTDTNNYVSSASFNTTNGLLTLNRSGLSAVTVDLDDRYQLSGTSPDGEFVFFVDDGTDHVRSNSFTVATSGTYLVTGMIWVDNNATTSIDLNIATTTVFNSIGFSNVLPEQCQAPVPDNSGNSWAPIAFTVTAYLTSGVTYYFWGVGNGNAKCRKNSTPQNGFTNPISFIRLEGKI